VEAVLQVVRDRLVQHVVGPVGGGRLVDQSEPLREAFDVCVDGEGRFLEVKVQNHVCRLRPDAFYTGEPVLCLFGVHLVEKGERVLPPGLCAYLSQRALDAP
jgi:hypothetical protein